MECIAQVMKENMVACSDGEGEVGVNKLAVDQANHKKQSSSDASNKFLYSKANKEALVSNYIRRAQARGSRAKTLSGAIAFAKKNPVSVIEGWARMAVPASRAYFFSRRKIDFDPGSNWSHSPRVNRRAGALWAALRSGILMKNLAVHQQLPCDLTPDVGETVRQLAISHIERVLSERLWDCWPYRYSQSSWAGGHHAVTVTIGATPEAQGGSNRVWSKNGKWSGTDSFGEVTVTERCLHLLGPNLLIGGLLTLDCEAVGTREYQATWVEQGRGFALKMVSGWIIRGHHIEAGSLDEARHKVAKARRAKFLALAGARVQRYLKSAAFDLNQIQVTRQDSLAGGNCASGTDAFMTRFEEKIAGRSSISAAELLLWENSSATRAAVAVAVVRQGGDKKK